MYHEYDFNLKAEHHFFATSHGKGPCNVIGGKEQMVQKVQKEKVQMQV